MTLLIIVVVAFVVAQVALGSVIKRMGAALAVVRMSMVIHGFACCEVGMVVVGCRLGGVWCRIKLCAEAFDFAIYPAVTEVLAVYLIYYCDVFAYLCDEGGHLVWVVRLC